MTITEMLAERKRLMEEAKAIQKTADTEERGLSEDEEATINKNLEAAKDLETKIEEARAVEERQAALRTQLDSADSWEDQLQPQQTRVPQLAGDGASLSRVNITGGEASSEFSHFGEFLHHVRLAAFSDADHARLQGRTQAAISGAGTTVDAEMGFLVPTEFSRRILEHMHEVGTIFNLPFMRLPLSGNTIEIPFINEISRADGSRYGGVQGYWVGEATAPTDTNPTVGQLSLKLKKAGCLGYVTEELMSDSTAVGALMERVFSEELLFKVEDAIVRGDGLKKPMGIKNSACKIEVSAETNQTADTIWGPNITKMWARRNPRGGRSNVWLYNQDCEPYLLTATAEGRYGSGATLAEGVSLFDPPSTRNGGIGTIMGRPALPVEYCDTVGTPGDLILFDPTQYVLAQKAGDNMSVEDSIHVRFTQGERTFRAFYRVDGQPWWNAALTPYQGTNTQSPVVTLASR